MIYLEQLFNRTTIWPFSRCRRYRKSSWEKSCLSMSMRLRQCH
nr:MAG TPA: hypothetical protein [Caudoviricetes sp.]